ncbi:uncharacterized protein PpBr36_11454 [Pyricularia pennisetigena]|uniref:uncharacterized protein n=1 Tax=Pyricularia pennisetigena TaxID=1578925 RepID=UPI00114D6571|nr:uncharacterized protein PpBr36_11454 [Pyricularia pennisetigena]TLS20254.1 hypothetical protein PpBr36_11454 [Pyricularia pennisetigena]
MAPDRGSDDANLRSRSRPARPSSPLMATAAIPAAAAAAAAAAADDDLHTAAEVEVDGHSFTVRGVAVGILIGVVLCFSNMYFGLQTGWISVMTMPASLLGYGFFRTLSRHLKYPFTPVENVLVQTVAASVGIVPLGAGFVGVIPAMNYLLTEDEMGPVRLGVWDSIVWSLGLCYFGCVFAMLLRRQVIIRERLRFPSGFSTAVLIGVLHGRTTKVEAGRDSNTAAEGGFASLAGQPKLPPIGSEEDEDIAGDDARPSSSHEWKANVRLLLICFCISGVATVSTYFVPVLRNLPVFGSAAAAWLWTLNPSLAYVGQGIIMGPATTLHMLLGAVVGWGVLSPLAKAKGWAPGRVDDWETGSKGWIVWTSLTIMLADAVVSLGFVVATAVWPYLGALSWRDPVGSGLALLRGQDRRGGYMTVDSSERRDGPQGDGDGAAGNSPEAERDAPEDQVVRARTVWMGLPLSMLLCVASIRYVFGSDLVPLYAIFAAVIVAMPLSVIAVRAMGVTDLNPVSGISKLAQLFFALVVPRSNKAGILINLVAGAVSESGALQAGDLMQDLKTGHLLGAAPKAQFYGQVIGATVGAVVSALVYKLYTSVYTTIPNDLFQAPTALVWIFTARLVASGKGLPPMAAEWAGGAAVLFAVLTAVKMVGPRGAKWQAYIPGGLAVAVGMYNVPSFTLARTIGGVLSWWWRSVMGREDTPLIITASGFILGEGFLSIANLLMESFGVPHL